MFSNNSCKVLNKDNQVMLTATMAPNGIYIVDTPAAMKRQVAYLNSSSQVLTSTSMQTWHRRLAHLIASYLQSLHKQPEINFNPKEKLDECDTCIFVKSLQRNHSNQVTAEHQEYWTWSKRMCVMSSCPR